MNTRSETGIAMIVAIMAMLLMSALGVALILTTSSETAIAGNFRNGQEALYAADAAVERAMEDILTVPDWNKLLDGTTQSAFVDGTPSGTRTLRDGSTIDLTQAINMANCQKISTCSAADMNAITAERPWGREQPALAAYAYSNLRDMLPATDTINSEFYITVMVADDPSESDGDRTKDGADATNLGARVIAMRAEAFGPRGAHKVIELTLSRTDTTELERGYTGQRGQDEQNRRARKAAVQTPGKALTQQTLNLTAGGIQ